VIHQSLGKENWVFGRLGAADGPIACRAPVGDARLELCRDISTLVTLEKGRLGGLLTWCC